VLPAKTSTPLSASEHVQWIRQDRWIHYSRAEQVLNRLSDLLTYPGARPYALSSLIRRNRNGTFSIAWR